MHHPRLRSSSGYLSLAKENLCSAYKNLQEANLNVARWLPFCSLTKAFAACATLFRPPKKVAVRYLFPSLSANIMEAATRAAVFPDVPKFPREAQTLEPFPAEAASKAKADARHHTNGGVNDASIAKTISRSDTATNAPMNGTDNEASTAPAQSSEEATAETVVNGHGESPTASRMNGDVPPQDGTDHREPALVTQNTNGPVTETPNPLVSNGITVDADTGDCDGNFTVTPVPLTDGHQEGPVLAPVKNGHFDDIWSPATKLKRRLENTKDLIVCPGVYDGFSARIALSVGFDALYMV